MTLEFPKSPAWMPSASIEALKARANLYHYLRTFFAERQVLEVDVPVLGQDTVTDPFIDSIRARNGAEWLYLQTSPEFYMKRLLASGSGDIYSLGKAFRAGEQGARHNPEFTLLEWYRLGFDDSQLREEVSELLQGVLPIQQVQQLSYRDWFEQTFTIDPHTIELTALENLAREHVPITAEQLGRDDWLDLLITHVLEPQLPKQTLTFVYDYPVSQAALAKVLPDAQGQPVAKRFEAFWQGMELANGYWELQDSQEQQRRFVKDGQLRWQHQRAPVSGDDKLLQALAHGLPDCAGVALGVDRLLLLLLGKKQLADVLAFDAARW